jgi:hypothetical protein
MGVSGGMLAAPFRKPARPRLLAAVANPLPGDRASGMALRSGHFLVHGLKLPIMQVDFAGVARLAPPVEQAVHGFGWLADLEAAGQVDRGGQIAMAAIRSLRWPSAFWAPGCWPTPRHPRAPARARRGAWTMRATGCSTGWCMPR